MPAGLAIPDLLAVGAAVFLILLATSLWLAGQMLQRSLSHAPVIGPWIGAHIVAWLFDASDHVAAAGKASWHAAAQMFTWAERWITSTYDTLVFFAADAAATIDHIVTVQIPREVSVLAGQVTSALAVARALAVAEAATVRAWAGREIAAARQAADTGIAAAERDITTARTDALTWARDALTLADRYAQAGIAGAESLAQAGLSALAAAEQTALADLRAGVSAADTALLAEIGSGLATVRAYALDLSRGVSAGIYTDLETWGNQAVARAWPDAGNEIDALRRAAGADFPWLNDLAGVLGGAGTAGLLGALIRSMATSQALTRLATDCVLPSCRNLSGLSGLLHELEALIGGGLLFELLAEMVTHPVQSAHDIDTQISTLVDDTIKGFASLLGA